MSQDARRDEEVATQRRARLLGLTYFDTSQMVNKTLYKDLIPLQDMYNMRVVPLQADQSTTTFGIINTTSQQSVRLLQQKFSDRRNTFLLISDAGFRELMHLYDPPK
ncbi:MAG: hypothetical protein ABWY71_02210, partial [Candidatus Saccharimonadales bacterium]